MSRSKSRHNAAWMVPACLGLGARKTPFHLVELGGAAGLNLIADYLEREPLFSEQGEALPGPESYADCPYPILSRTGLDPAAPAPRPSDDPRAAELFLSLGREPSGPKTRACPWEAMADFIAERLRPAPEEGLLVFNLDQGKNWDAARLTKVLAPWREVGFWVELERAEGSESLELVVHRMVEGKLASATLGRCGSDGRLILLKGWNFLQPISPVVSPRFTFEEPPKQGRR